MAQETSFADESLAVPKFERFRFSKEDMQNTKRILFISKKVWKDLVHFVEGYGYFRCIAQDNESCPACLKGDSYAKERWATHVLEYNTDANGNVSVPFGYKVKAFVYGKQTAKSIQKIQQSLNEKMHKIDVFVTCTSAEFQNLTFMPVFDEAGSKLSQLPEDLKNQCRIDIVQKISEIDVTRVLAPVVAQDVIQNVMDGKFVRRGTKNVTTAQPAVAPAQTSFETPKPVTTVPTASPVITAPVPVIVTEPTKDDVTKKNKEMLEKLAEIDF